MALDVGTKTIGVAVSDPLHLFAQPVTTLRRRGVRQDCDELAHLVREREVEELIVGLPLELDGTEARSARLARQIGERMRELTALPLTYIDERYSSVEAERHLLAHDLSRAERRAVIDQAAASVILQSYLDYGDWSRLT